MLRAPDGRVAISELADVLHACQAMQINTAGINACSTANHGYSKHCHQGWEED